ncbi:small ribosomal subunit protein bS21c isoform X2 [Henckelia pumila]|uniref:small ribosomal subunit protein bS21c isoform X2 n=1 Tax=Henckelia pumila TaxID=405737 RepID=UPI003C6E232C
MATSFLPNLFSFFTPSKQPPPPSSLPVPPPSQISISSTNRGFSSDELRSNTSPLSSTSDVTSVICPSLAYANTLFFRSAYNVQVIVDDNEPEEKLLGRFRREVMRAGVIQECKRRRFFENKQDEKKRKTREAAKRNRRRRPQWRNGTQDKEEPSKTKKRDDDGDNWDVPAGALT